MSVQAISCALALRGVSTAEKLLLLALSNYADDNMRCWPSQKRLAGECAMTDRSVRRVLKELEDRRIISRESRSREDGSRQSDVITLHFFGEVVAPPDRCSGPPDTVSAPPRTHVPAPPDTRSGLTTFEPPLEPSEDKKSSEAKASSPKDRGARLPVDWQPSETDIAFALAEGLTHEEITRGTDRFRDYWLSLAGSRSTKLDWVRTWRNWIRKTGDDKRRHSSRLASRPAFASGGGRGASSFADLVMRRHGAAEN